MSEDKIFETEDGTEPFRFNENVARVFPDMLRRSIPGYAASIEAIGSLAARHVRAGTTCYDLGCSLGAATLAMRQGIQQPCCRIVAVDTITGLLVAFDFVLGRHWGPFTRLAMFIGILSFLLLVYGLILTLLKRFDRR